MPMKPLLFMRKRSLLGSFMGDHFGFNKLSKSVGANNDPVIGGFRAVQGFSTAAAAYSVLFSDVVNFTNHNGIDFYYEKAAVSVVADPEFDTACGVNWTCVGAIIASNVAIFTTGTGSVTQAAALTTGKRYRVKIKGGMGTTLNGETYKISLGGGDVHTLIGDNRTYTIEIVAGAGNDVVVEADGDAGNVSFAYVDDVYEYATGVASATVSPAQQIDYTMTWGTPPVAGQRILFENDGSNDYTVDGSDTGEELSPDWDFDDPAAWVKIVGSLLFVGSGNLTIVNANAKNVPPIFPRLKASTTYRLSGNIIALSGGTVAIDFYVGSAPSHQETSTGAFSADMTMAGTGGGVLELNTLGSGSTATLSYLSLKEVLTPVAYDPQILRLHNGL